MWNSWTMALVPQYIHTGSVAIWIGTDISTKGFKNCIIEISSVWASSFTIKAQGAMWIGTLWDTKPDFSSAKTTSNPWDYIEMIDLEDGTAIDWDTGVAFSAADVRLFELNVNAIDFINLDITTWVSWAVTARVRLYTND